MVPVLNHHPCGLDEFAALVERGRMPGRADRPASRGQRRGFFWQDWYAAWTLLRCWSEPAEGIVAVEVEAAAPHVDDIVVYHADGVAYRQLKHTVTPRGSFTGSALFSGLDGKPPLISKLFRGWDTVRRRTHLPCEVHLVTNAVASASARNQVIAPAELDQTILRPARSEADWRPGRKLQSIVNKLGDLAGAPDEQTLVRFLAALRLFFEEPDTHELQEKVVRILRDNLLRSPATVKLEAGAWVARVYDLATQHGGARRLTRDDIDDNLRRSLGWGPPSTKHRLALPEHHLTRSELADLILEKAHAVSSGYLLVCGPPGCGKTTLATWLANEHPDEILVRYHVFDPRRSAALEREDRAGPLTFVRTLFDALRQRFPDTLRPHAPTSDTLGESVDALWNVLGSLASGRTRLVVIDGIDHVIRAGLTAGNLFSALRQAAPPGIVFVMFGQPDWPYPPWLANSQRVEMPPFTSAETHSYLCTRLAWDPADPAAAAVASELHVRTAGNPLSLFYNVTALARRGGAPVECHRELAGLMPFGERPHEAYEQLLADLPRVTRIESPSLQRELLAHLAVARAAMTAERLCAAFAGDLTQREAKDLLEKVRPILTERGRGRFSLFCDDFRRYAELHTSPEDRIQAHRRHASALRQDWAGDELCAVAEHLWHGTEYEPLSRLPEQRALEEWLALASPATVSACFRLATAAAFSLHDDIAIIKTCLAFHRVGHLVTQSLHSGDPDPERGLSGWSFVIPPRESGGEGLARRARAIGAAAAGHASEPKLAHEIVARFRLPDGELPDLEERDASFARDYFIAWTRWLLRSGGLAELANMASAGPSKWIGDAIAEEMSSEPEPEVLKTWTRALAGAQPWLDRELSGAAFTRLAENREAAARAIVRALLSATSLSAESRRDAGVLGELLDGREILEMEHVKAGIWWNHDESVNAEEWRDFFLHGFVFGAVGPECDLDRCRFPDQFADYVGKKNHGGHSRVRLAAFLWRVGCACALARRGRGLLAPRDLGEVLGPLAVGRLPGLDGLPEYAFLKCAYFYLPLLVRGVRQSDALAAESRRLIEPQARLLLSGAGPVAFGLLEGLWLLSPEIWQELAGEAHKIERLPQTSAEERKTWFDYWTSRAMERGVDPPPRFAGLASISQIGVIRKAYPASLAVELLPACKGSNDDRIKRVQRVVDLIIQLDGEPEGGRGAFHHLPTILAYALGIDPALVVTEFVRATAEHPVHEPFGSVAAWVVREWLESDDSDAAEPELIAAWHWVAASPGSFCREEADGRDAAKLVAQRLRNLGAVEAAHDVEQWLECLASPQPNHGDDAETEEVNSDTRRDNVEPPPNIDDVTLMWLTPGWYPREHRALREHLAAGGERAWQELCDRLAPQVLLPTTFHDGLALVADGLPGVRSLSSPEAAFDVATAHVAEMVRFQGEPAPRFATPAVHTRADAFVHLLARGLDVTDAEIVRRTIRSLVALARVDDLGRIVERELGARLEHADYQVVTYALLALRALPQVGSDTRVRVDALRTHSSAWCRWLACSILGAEPAWEPPRALVTKPGLLAVGAGADQRILENTFFHSATTIRESYVRRLGALVDADEVEIRARLETECRSVPQVPRRPTGWRRSEGLVISQEPMGKAAGQLATRLASSVVAGKLGALLSTVAPCDPWLVTSSPRQDAPAGWIEVCRSEETGDGDVVEHTFRCLGIVQDQMLAEAKTGDYLTDLAEVGCAMLFPEAPRDFAWVAEVWEGIDPPAMKKGPVTPLCFWNSPFTQLRRDRFTLVPRWNLPQFKGLRFEVNGVPQWLRPGHGPVLVAAYQEWNIGHSYSSHYPNVTWMTAWHASPAWLVSFRLPGTSLVYVQRTWTGKQRGDSSDDEGSARYEVLIPTWSDNG